MTYRDFIDEIQRMPDIFTVLRVLADRPGLPNLGIDVAAQTMRRFWTVSPKVSRSMHVAAFDLKLERLDVIHAGKETFPLANRIRAVGARKVGGDVERL